MNKETAHKYLPLVQALVDGKILQYRDGLGNWGDTGGIYSPYFEADPTCYRVKPEPRTFDLWLDHDTGCLTTDELIRDFSHVRLNSLERITVQEVLK